MTVYVKINTMSKNIMIAAIYRAPKPQAADDIAPCDEIESIIHKKQAVIVEDFNCPSID